MFKRYLRASLVIILISVCTILITHLAAEREPLRAQIFFHQLISGHYTVGIVDSERMLNVRANGWCLERMIPRTDNFQSICVGSTRNSSYFYIVGGPNYQESYPVIPYMSYLYRDETSEYWSLHSHFNAQSVTALNAGS